MTVPTVVETPDAALLKATAQDNHAAAMAALAAGANVNTTRSDGESILTLTVMNNDLELAKYLLAHGADVEGRSRNGTTNLMAAVMNNRGVIADLLLRHGAKINAKDWAGRTPLFWTAAYDAPHFRSTIRHDNYDSSAEITRLLLAHGATYRQKDIYGVTPLQEAIKRGHLETARVLRQAGAKR